METRVTLKVPYDKKSEFTARFFHTFSESIDFLGYTYGKSPNAITFQGKLGLEMFNFIKDMSWDISKFNPSIEASSSIYSKIKISYSEKIKIENQDGVQRSDSLNGKTINGIPGPDTVSKIMSYSSNSSISVTKWDKPVYEIILKRDK
jgi:hypothetical protein